MEISEALGAIVRWAEDQLVRHGVDIDNCEEEVLEDEHVVLEILENVTLERTENGHD